MTMQLNSNDLDILKNFNSINPSIAFTEGNVLRTIAPNKTILAKANLTESIERPFAIYDLSRFLGVLSLFKEPKIELGEKELTITEGSKRIRYVYADLGTIVKAPEEDIAVESMGDVAFSFVLTDENIREAMKASGVLSAPEFVFVVEDGKLFFRACNTKTTSFNEYSIELEDFTPNVDKAKVIVKIENFKPMHVSYKVTVYNKGPIHLQNDNVEYWIPSESNSEF